MSEDRLDSVDEKILEQKFLNSRQTQDEIAEYLSIEVNRVDKGIQRLRDLGIMGNPMAVVHPVKVGYPVISYHFIDSQNNYNRDVTQSLEYFDRWTGAQMAMTVLGEYDAIARKVSTDDAALSRFTTNVLSYPETDVDTESDSLTSQVYCMKTFKISQLIRWRGNKFNKEQQTGVPEIELTDNQLTVLSYLQKDASRRTDIGFLASQTGSDPDDIENIIDYLEDNVILNYSVELNTELGALDRAFFMISTRRGMSDDVLEGLQEESPFHVPYIGSGIDHNEADIVVDIIFNSKRELEEITDRLQSIEGIQSISTFLGDKSVYSNEAIPIR